MEQNARRVGRPEPYPKPEGTRRNQDMMIKQNAKRLGNDDGTECQKRLGRQAPEPYQEPHGTQRQKSRETSPATLPGTTWNQEMMEHNVKRLGRQAPEPYLEPETMMEQRLFLGRIETPLSSRAVWGKNTMFSFMKTHPK